MKTHNLLLNEARLSLIPITEGEKRPHAILGAKHDLFGRRATSEEAQRWIDAGVTSWAVANGAVSNNLATLDFDEKHYEGLYDRWYERLSEEQKAILATTVISTTRNKGHHVRYFTETSQPTIKLSRSVVDGKVETTSEVRGEGSYALVPPSDGYEFIQGDLDGIPLVTDEMHEAFIDILRTFNEIEDEPATEYEYKATDVTVGDRPGDRFNANATWEEILAPHEWVNVSGNQWRRPGKEAGEGISATTDHNGVPMLYVFSSAAIPFAQNKGYSKFHAFALLNHGGDFKAAARAAAELYPQEQNKDEELSNWLTNKPHLWTIGEILTHDFGDQQWLAEMLIPIQGMTVLSGNPGDGKTYTTIHIALCVVRNVPVFGKFKVTQGNVLMIDEEDHVRDLQNRLSYLGATEADNIYYLSQSGFKVDKKEPLDAVLQIVKEKNIKLVVLDSLVRIHGQEENEATAMAKVFHGLQAIIKEGASILFTHHHKKQSGYGPANPGQMLRGSSDILAAVDCHISIEKKRDDPSRLIIKQTKLRQAEALMPFEVLILKGEKGPSGFEYIGEYDIKKLKVEEAAMAVLAIVTEGPKSRQDIIAILKEESIGKTAAEDGIKLAEEEDYVERIPKEDLPKGERRAFYRRPGTGAVPTTIELPAPQLPNGAGEQEDDWDADYNEEESSTLDFS
jgi:hypothetical protein